MTEAFAATVAAVAPVLLLVLVVEINNSRPRIQAFYRDLGRRETIAQELFRAGEPTPEQVRQAARQVDASASEEGFRFAKGGGFLLYTLCSGFVMVMLLFAELRSLAWLGDDPMGSSSGDARLCAIALTVGFAWVCFTPILGIAEPIVTGTLGMLRGAKDWRRMEQLMLELHTSASRGEETADRQDA